MRIKVEFFPEKLTVFYRTRIMSAIKEWIEHGNKTLYEVYYAGNTKIKKPLCFGVVLDTKNYKEEEIKIDDYIVKDRVFYLQKPAVLYISSSNNTMILSILSGIYKERQLKNQLNIKRVMLIKEEKIDKDEVLFRTISPVVVQDKDDKQYTPEDKDFEECLNYILNSSFKNLVGRPLFKPIKFQNINTTKRVVKHTLKGFREKTGKPYMFLTTTHGVFKLTGDKRDLNIIYQNGLGNKVSQGFGLLQIL